MKLRGIEFGPMLDAAGARNFFGEGYPYHRLLKPSGLTFAGSTFVAKTTTLSSRAGNMPLRRDGVTPKHFKPECIHVDFVKGIALNAVGLSGPGAKFLLEAGKWQARPEPFFLSFMSVASTSSERREELRWFVGLLQSHLPDFRIPLGLQINFSCPNVGVHSQELVDEVTSGLDIASALEIPLMPKFSVLTPPEIACEISKHPDCDAVCVSNTIPWGALPDRINWKKLFGSEESPLKKFGGGGLSGAPLLPLVAEWVRKARHLSIRKPINAGGGILGPCDAGKLHAVRASSVFIGSIAFLRWWRMKKTIHYTHTLFSQRRDSRV